MPNTFPMNNPSERKAYIITGPTLGIGLSTAFELAKRGAVFLVGRDKGNVNAVQKAIEGKGGHAVSVVCDLLDIGDVRRAAPELVALHLPIVARLHTALSL